MCLLVDGEPVAVLPLLALGEDALIEHVADHLREPALLLLEEAVLDVEGDPAVVRDDVERLGERFRRDVPEA